jgi:hypothetical protein
MSICLLVHDLGGLRGSFQLEAVFHWRLARRAIDKLRLVEYAIDYSSLRKLNRTQLAVPIDLYV